jgi:hypothetical protein
MAAAVVPCHLGRQNVAMSEKVQRGARDRRNAALERERAARERADRAAERGDDQGAETQRNAAHAHRHAATASEALRLSNVAIEGERVGEPAPRVPRADADTLWEAAAGDSQPETSQLDAAITDAVNHAAAVAEAARDAAEMALEILASVAALLAERSRAPAIGAQPADTAAEDGSLGALPADVVEIARLEAHAAGVDVADYLRDAILDHIAPGSRARGDRELDARLRAARREAARLRAQSRAVHAQNAQVTRRAARADAPGPPDTQRARRAGDGTEDDPGREDR